MSCSLSILLSSGFGAGPFADYTVYHYYQVYYLTIIISIITVYDSHWGINTGN